MGSNWLLREQLFQSWAEDYCLSSAQLNGDLRIAINHTRLTSYLHGVRLKITNANHLAF